MQVAGEMQLEPGGSANLLILLSRLGASAVALGTLGTDLWGEQVFHSAGLALTGGEER